MKRIQDQIIKRPSTPVTRRKRPIVILSGIMAASGSILGVYALIRTWVVRAGLPEGVCPIDNNRPLLYLALGLLGASFLLDLAARFMRPLPEKEPPHEE